MKNSQDRPAPIDISSKASIPARAGLARSWIMFVATAVALAFTNSSEAHDPHEITADVHFEKDRLEVLLTQTHLTALASCGLDTKNRQNFGPRDFAAVKASLEACARGAVEITGVTGVLVPTGVSATFSSGGEIEFRLSFPRPPAGNVSLHAAQLERLAIEECDFEVTLLIDGKFQGHHVLSLKAPDLKFALPEAPRD